MNEKIFKEIINNLCTIKDKNGNYLNMDSIIISQNDNTFEHYFTNADIMNDLRSVSKPIISIAIGMAIENNLLLRNDKLNLETRIFPFFKDKVIISNKRNLAKLEKITLKHVLTHTIGFADGLLFSKDIKDKDPNTLLNFVFNYDIVFEPGEVFVYSNVGPYIISALIQEEFGINLSDWIYKTLFTKLDIHEFAWKNYGKYCAGASGLKMKMSDLHKIGKLILNNGVYKDKNIVSGNWINKMCSIQVLTPSMYDEKRVFPKYGYGFYLYICKNGNYYCDGTDGQYLIIIPEKNILITTFGHQSDMKPITECFRILL